jgi:hypothetical protein
MKITLLNIIVLPLVTIVAILGIFYPKRLQIYYVDYCSKRKYMRPFLWFAKSNLFIINSIFCGILLLFMIVVLILVTIYGVHK